MNLSEIKAQLADFKAIKAKGSITPESLGSLLENIVMVLGDTLEEMKEPLSTVHEKVLGLSSEVIVHRGEYFCPINTEQPITKSGSSGYVQVSDTVIHLKAGQTLEASAYRLPGMLFFIDELEDGAFVKSVWQSNSAYNIQFTATEDCAVVVGMYDGGKVIEELACHVTTQGMENKLLTVESTIKNAKVLNDSLAVTHILQVNVFESKTQFVQDETLDLILANLNFLQVFRLAVQVNYASGSKVLFHATCVNPNYISLHAKAGSCELHLASDGSFTIAGTSLW